MSDQEWPSGPGDGEGSTPTPADPPPPAAPPPATPPPAAPPPATPPPATPPPAPPPPPPSPGGYAGTAPTGVGQADVGIRFGARVLDSVLLLVVNLLISAVILFGVIFSDVSGGGGLMSFSWSIGSFITSLVLLAITLGYFVFMETTRGATVGKLLLNLEVRNRAGGYPTPEQSLRRNAFYVLNIVPVIGGLLQLAAVVYIAVTISQDPDNRGWHDHFADTVVVRTG